MYFAPAVMVLMFSTRARHRMQPAGQKPPKKPSGVYGLVKLEKPGEGVNLEGRIDTSSIRRFSAKIPGNPAA
jgi:hypothetical protein